MSDLELEGEVLAEEDAEPGEGSVRVLQPYEEAATPVLRDEARTAAEIAAAGGVLAGAATVAAVRAVGAVASGRRRSPRRLSRRDRPNNVVASRSFLVDVHLLGR